MGAIFGAVLDADAHRAMGGQRDLAPVSHTGPERYQVMVDDEVAPRRSASSNPSSPGAPARPRG